MFEHSHTIFVNAKPEKVWDYLLNFDGWWLYSNPDHLEIKILNPQQGLKVGTQIRFLKVFAGLIGEAFGEIKHLKRKQEMIWEGKAKYQFLGFTFFIKEGFSWRLISVENGTTFIAEFWAEFPKTFWGRLGERFFTKTSNRMELDYEHARQELVFIKQNLEGNPKNLWAPLTLNEECHERN